MNKIYSIDYKSKSIDLEKSDSSVLLKAGIALDFKNLLKEHFSVDYRTENINLEKRESCIPLESGITIRFQDLLDEYLFIEELTSQINNTRIIFTTSFHYYTDKLVVWINGLKEKVTIINDNSFSVTKAPTTEMTLEVMYVRK